MTQYSECAVETCQSVLRFVDEAVSVGIYEVNESGRPCPLTTTSMRIWISLDRPPDQGAKLWSNDGDGTFSRGSPGTVPPRSINTADRDETQFMSDETGASMPTVRRTWGRQPGQIYDRTILVVGVFEEVGRWGVGPRWAKPLRRLPARDATYPDPQCRKSSLTPHRQLLTADKAEYKPSCSTYPRSSPS